MGNDTRFARILMDSGNGYLCQVAPVAVVEGKTDKDAAMAALGTEDVSRGDWRSRGYRDKSGREVALSREDPAFEAASSAMSILRSASDSVGGLGDFHPVMKEAARKAMTTFGVPEGQAAALVRKYGYHPVYAASFMANAVTHMNPYMAHCVIRRCLSAGDPENAFMAVGFPKDWWNLGGGRPAEGDFIVLAAIEKASWKSFLAPKRPKVARIGSRRFENLVRRIDGFDIPSPKWVRCYDDRKSADRYTVIYAKRKECGETPYVGMSAHPFHPLGIGMHGTHPGSMDADRHGFVPAIGRKTHLGWRIPFEELPPDCQRLVWSDYADYWEIENAMHPIIDEKHVWK